MSTHRTPGHRRAVSLPVQTHSDMAARLPSERRSKNPFPPTNPFSSKYESPSRRESVDTFPPTNPFSAHHSRRRHHHHHSHPRRRTRSVVEPDLIDRLDPWQYHHEGPFDAVNRALNTIPDRSPIEAVRSSNEEALRATPLHNISDALERHRPLEGVAYYPPGSTDPYGKTYDYEEGSNMNSVERGNFMRIHGFVSTSSSFSSLLPSNALSDIGPRNSPTKISKTTHSTNG